MRWCKCVGAREVVQLRRRALVRAPGEETKLWLVRIDTISKYRHKAIVWSAHPAQIKPSPHLLPVWALQTMAKPNIS